MPPARVHPYVSHLVRVAPRPAGTSLDFVRSCLSRVVGSGTGADAVWGVTTPEGTLRLGGRFRRIVPRPRGYQPLRVATGRLILPAARRFGPVDVTLELLPWSSRWSELALASGPLRRTQAGTRAERAYLAAAHATLDRLARAIESPPAEWLARLVAGQPVPQSEHVAIVHRPRARGPER
jgi:hypothetical protein